MIDELAAFRLDTSVPYTIRSFGLSGSVIELEIKTNDCLSVYDKNKSLVSRPLEIEYLKECDKISGFASTADDIMLVAVTAVNDAASLMEDNKDHIDKSSPTTIGFCQTIKALSLLLRDFAKQNADRG